MPGYPDNNKAKRMVLRLEITQHGDGQWRAAIIAQNFWRLFKDSMFAKKDLPWICAQTTVESQMPAGIFVCGTIEFDAAVIDPRNEGIGHGQMLSAIWTTTNVDGIIRSVKLLNQERIKP